MMLHLTVVQKLSLNITSSDIQSARLLRYAMLRAYLHCSRDVLILESEPDIRLYEVLFLVHRLTE